jgi:hypothetical protein
MHQGTERSKREIATLFEKPFFREKLLPPTREQVLPGTRYKSDFAFRTSSNGWFFVEDDDASRCLGNFIKHWQWAEQNPHEQVSLVHLVGPGAGQMNLLEFVREKAHSALSSFRSEIVRFPDWKSREWIGWLESAAARLPPFHEP